MTTDELAEIRNERIRRATLAGPASVTNQATVAEMDRNGQLTILRPGTNDWVCIPGNQDIIGATDMCADPMGMVWMRDGGTMVMFDGTPTPTCTSAAHRGKAANTARVTAACGP